MNKLRLIKWIALFAFSAVCACAQSEPSSTTSPPAVAPIRGQADVPPPLGTFHDDAYSNDYFGIYYPLSRDWVRETDLVRSKIAAERNRQGTYVLLAALHIPQTHETLRADSSFNVLAMHRPGTASLQECKQSLAAMASELQSRKEGEQKGDLTQFTIAGHDFYRGDFEYRLGTNHVTTLCTAVKDYLLRWNIAGWSKQAIEIAISTLNSMTAAPPQKPPLASPLGSDPKPTQVPEGISTGLLIKKVRPIYPPEALRALIEGTVRLSAVINKTGDVVDLEVMDGPLELVVSAVDAVRQWKYRPYLLNSAPVDVQTQVIVNYSIRY